MKKLDTGNWATSEAARCKKQRLEFLSGSPKTIEHEYNLLNCVFKHGSLHPVNHMGWDGVPFTDSEAFRGFRDVSK